VTCVPTDDIGKRLAALADMARALVYHYQSRLTSGSFRESVVQMQLALHCSVPLKPLSLAQ
jgi:hypothetical protein